MVSVVDGGLAYLVFGEQSIANPGEEHHGDQHRYHYGGRHV